MSIIKNEDSDEDRSDALKDYALDAAARKLQETARAYCASCLRRAGAECRITHKTTAQSVTDCKRAGWRDLGLAQYGAEHIALRFKSERLYKPTQDTDRDDDL